MADASYLQTSFLGGEWSPLIQGRMDDPRYRSGMKTARNVLPIEEGAASRRPGTRLIGPTRKGVPGVLRAFDFSQSHPYLLELTAGHMRFIAGSSHIIESAGRQVVIGVSATNPVVLQTLSAHGWATGDEVTVVLNPGDPANASIAGLLGRQIEVTVTDSTHFSCADAVTGASIDGTSMVLAGTGLLVSRIADFATPYLVSELQAINQVQDQSNLLLLHNAHPPQAVIATGVESTTGTVKTNATFTIGAATFVDGPYYDPPTDGTTITPSAVNGSVTLTLAGGSTRFAATDVGRFVRLFSEPAAWASGTTYASGAQVKFNGAYYQSLSSGNVGNEPDQDVVHWGVTTTAAVWNWAIITAFTDTTHVTATLKHVLNPDGTTGPDLPRTSACSIWRLGLFSPTTGYPSAGTFHEGRLWLTGIIGNRIDGSVSNDFFNFTPTAADGTVADNNAIDAVFNSGNVNQIFWMEPDALGIVCGTQAGEWLVQASATNDTLTPTSIQAHRRSKYGSANVPAKRCGITIAFVQRYNSKLLEYITTDFRGLSAHNIALTGKHLTQKGIAEIAYQSEKVPTIWARTNDGALISCTYKRESPYASDPPAFAGWAHHDLGGGFTVESVQAGPNYDGSLDAVSVVVSDGTHRWVLLVSDLFDVDWTIGDALFVDFAETPAMYEIITSSNPHVLRLYSLQYLAGKSVDIFAAGIDCGTLPVATDGHVDIPIDSTTIPLLTSSWLSSLNSPTNFHGLGLSLANVVPGMANVPTITGIANLDATAIVPANYAPGSSTVDWDGQRFFIYDPVNSKLQIDSTATLGQIGTLISWAGAGQAITYGEDGFLYGATIATNAAILHRFNLSTNTEDATFGTASAGFPSGPTTWAAPRDMDVVTNGDGSHCLVSTSFDNTVNEIAVLNLNTAGLSPLTFSFTVAMTEGRGVVTRGKSFGGFGQTHVLSLAGNNGGTGITLGLYRIFTSRTGGAGYKSATINASAFGTGFTHFDSLRGIILDELDGHLIVHLVQSQLTAWSSGTTYAIGDFSRSLGHDFLSLTAANLNHAPAVGGNVNWQDLGASSGNGSDNIIAKINSRTGAVLWVNVVGALSPGEGSQINATRCRNGVYLFYDNAGGTTVIHEINTITGVDTHSAPIPGVSASYQFYNDFNGELIFSSGYTNGAGTPTPIGSTPSSWTKNWATLGPAAGPAVPAAAPPSVGVNYTIPVAIGYTYPTQGQTLRPIAQQETGAQNGPALGKTRRTHMYAALLQQAQGIKFGTDFITMHAAQLSSKGNVPVAKTTLYSDIHQDTLEDDYTFDSMLCWEIDRPYPATVCTLGAFLHTQDR